MDITKFNKAIVAIIGGAATVASMLFGANVDFLTPELIAAVGSIVTSILVFAVPNTPAKTPAE